jgi:hypothetical protein
MIDEAPFAPHRIAELVDDDGVAVVLPRLVAPGEFSSITPPAAPGLHPLALDAALLDRLAEALVAPTALAPVVSLLFPEGAALDAARLAVPPLRRRAHGPLFRTPHVRPRLFALRVDLSLQSGDATLSDLRTAAPALDGPHLALVYTQPWFTDVETAPDIAALTLTINPSQSRRIRR